MKLQGRHQLALESRDDYSEGSPPAWRTRDSECKRKAQAVQRACRYLLLAAIGYEGCMPSQPNTLAFNCANCILAPEGPL